MPSVRRGSRRGRSPVFNISFTFDDLLDRLATGVFNKVVEGLGQQRCPLDGEVLSKISPENFFCTRCKTKFVQETRDNDKSEGPFRPFDPFHRIKNRNGKSKTRPHWYDDIPPPRPHKREKQYRYQPPPPQPKLIRDDVALAYKTLELKPGVTKEDVKKKRRELALRYHTDLKGKDASDEKLKMINAAADFLIDIL